MLIAIWSAAGAAIGGTVAYAYNLRPTGRVALPFEFLVVKEIMLLDPKYNFYGPLSPDLGFILATGLAVSVLGIVVGTATGFVEQVFKSVLAVLARRL